MPKTQRKTVVLPRPIRHPEQHKKVGIETLNPREGIEGKILSAAATMVVVVVEVGVGRAPAAFVVVIGLVAG